jgi:ubiquinone/menaquinone biosynthesis C-methylase UbiE
VQQYRIKGAPVAVGVTTADSAYDEIAEWYDDSVNASSLIHDLVLPALFELIGNVEGLQVCDLACG